jgi:NADPH:quinone reductase-like Zn-dependent oxidoreductase
MRAMRAGQFSGDECLKLVQLPKPVVSNGKVLVRITAAELYSRYDAYKKGKMAWQT